jgi:cupredoxin-like protein
MIVAVAAAVVVAVVLHSRQSAGSEAGELPLQKAGCKPAAAKLAAKGPLAPATTIAVLSDGGTLSNVAIGGGYVVWSSVESENGGSTLYERKIDGGQVEVLNSPPVVYPAGLASGPNGVYVVGGDTTQDLLLIPHGGGAAKRVLTNLIAPLSEHDDKIGYAIGLPGGRREVGVLSMRDGSRQVIATSPQCMHGRCNRIDQVELTNDAMVWTEGAIGTHPSYLLRRPLGGGPISRLEITNDQQPDLAAGDDAVPFRRLGCAWQMWNGSTTSRALFDAPDNGQLIGIDRGSWYGTLGGQGQTVVSRGARDMVLDRAALVDHGGAGLYGGFALSGDYAVVGWNVYGAQLGPRGSVVIHGTGGTSAGSTGSGGGAATTVNITVRPGGCTPRTVTAPAGTVTFRVKSEGGPHVQYEIGRGGRVLGEVDDIPKGATKSFSLKLNGGRYNVYCGRVLVGQAAEEGDQNEHEDPSFSVVRLVHL